MTPDRTDANPDENAEHGVLEESGNLDTASITILGGHIAQVNVDLPVASDDDDLDDDVIEDEIPLDEADLAALDAPRVPSAVPAGIDDHAEIVHDPHVEQLPTGDIILEPHDTDATTEPLSDDDVHDAEIVDESPRDASEHEMPDAEPPAVAERVGDETAADAAAEPSAQSREIDEDQDRSGETFSSEEAEELASGDESVGVDEDDDVDAPTAADALPGEDLLSPIDQAQDDLAGAAESDPRAEDLADAEIVDDLATEADAAETVEALDATSRGGEDLEPDHAPADEREPETHVESDVSADTSEPLTHAPWVPAAVAEPEHGDTEEIDPEEARPHDSVPALAEPGEVAVEETELAATVPFDDDDDDDDDDADADDADDADDAEVEETETVADTPEPTRQSVDAPLPPVTAESQPAPPATAEVEADSAGAEPQTVVAPAAAPTTRAERAATGVIGTIPLTRRSAHQADDAARAADEAARVDRAHSLERVRTPAPEVTLTSKRIGQIDDARESSDLLTADRLLDPRQIARPEPEGLWQQLVYSVSRHRINLGDGRRARQRKDLDRRIATPLAGGARFVPVLSRKGGVGKTTVTSLLGMALADARDDRIIAVDANPDRGTLADRVGRPNGRTVRDLVRSHDEMVGYNDVSSIVARDATRLDVLASDSDPRVSEAFSDDDYRQVADVAAHYYSIVLTDTGTGIVHSVMGATLELADTLVIVAGLSVDEARLASETLTWLETNGYAARVRDAVVVLNNSRPGTPLVRESELEAHFRSRVRTVIRMPYDARIAAGSAITFRDLQPSTRQAARELAAAVVEGLRAPAVAA